MNSEFNSPNVSDWRRQPSYEDVRHSAVGVTTVPAIHWINRPTFQQVVQINGAQPPVPHLQSLSGASSGSTALTYNAGVPVVADNRSAVSTMPIDRRITYAA